MILPKSFHVGLIPLLCFYLWILSASPAGATLANAGVSGTQDWPTPGSNAVLSSTLVSNAQATVTNYSSTGFDLVVQNNGSTTANGASIRSNIAAFSSNGGMIRFLGTTPGTISYADIRANQGIFDLTSIKIGSADGTITYPMTFTITPLDSSFNPVAGASVTSQQQTAQLTSGQDNWITFTPTGATQIANFTGIYGVRIVQNSGIQVNCDAITVNNPRLASSPTVTTTAATGITSKGAMLNGSVNANGLSTTVTFDYGTTNSYGTTVTAPQSPVTGSSSSPVSILISGLAPGTTYHFRVNGASTGGTTNGSDQSFTTSAAPALLASGGNTSTTYQKVSQGLAVLSNSGKAVAYLSQVGGDLVTYTPSGPLFTGIIKVFDSTNNVVKTIDIRGGGYISSSSNYVNDMSVVALLNGGFAVAWTETDSSNNILGVRYDLFDNSGNLLGVGSGSLALSASAGSGVKLASLTGGGFAAVFGLSTQTAMIETFTYSAGTYTKNTEQAFLSGSTSVPGATADVARLYTFGGGGGFSIAALSNGGFVVGASIYDYVNSNYTPLGCFIFGFTATGTQQSFTGTGASGQYWQRVNWDTGQVADPMVLTSFTGGFASLNWNSTKSTWQMTVFNNDGSLVTTTPQIVSVDNNGSYSNKTYYASNITSVSPSIADVTTVLTSLSPTGVPMVGNPDNLVAGDVASLLALGSNIIAVLPNSNGGFSLASISQTTGNLVGSVVDSGITVPSSTILTDPKFVVNGSSLDAIYDVQQYQYSASGMWYYVLADIDQLGLNPIVVAPTISSISSTTANGSYDATTVIPITVTFSAPVTVTGTPTLALNSGGSASFASGSGTATLTFNYTVGATDNATLLDCSSTTALALAGGTINATTGGTAATLTLPTPGGANSLGANKAIVIDTTPPTIVSINRLTPTGQTTASNTVTFRVTYSEAVTVPGTSNFTVVAVNGSTIVGTVTGVTGTGTTRDVTVSITSGTGEFRLRAVN